MSKRQKRGGKQDNDQNKKDVALLTSEANANSPEYSYDANPGPSHGDADPENEETPASLMLILKELRGIGKEVKDFRNDTKLQLQDIRGELDKANTRLNEVENRVADHEDKLQNTDEIVSELITAHEKVHVKMISLEAYSRRETIRIYGVPEEAESGSQSMINFVEKPLQENLSILPSLELQIQRAHRALAAPSPEGSRPRYW